MLFPDKNPRPSLRPPTPYVRRPQRGEVRQHIAALDDLVALDHPVRTVSAFAETLDLKNVLDLDDKKLPHGSVDPMLILALWLWATIDGIGSARHLEKRCTEHLAYRWLCGGVEIGHQTLRDFRLIHGEALDRLLANGLAALIAENAIDLQLVSPEALKTQSLTGESTVRRRRRLKALAIAAAARVQELRTILDKDDPIDDERYNRNTYWRVTHQHSECAKAAVEQTNKLLWTANKARARDK
jgi:transposase